MARAPCFDQICDKLSSSIKDLITGVNHDGSTNKIIWQLYSRVLTSVRAIKTGVMKKAEKNVLK
jgi:hypothetical protein